MRLTPALLVAAAVTALVPATVAIADTTSPPASCDWVSFRNGPANHGASDCTAIGTANVSTLVPQLLYRTYDSVTSTPAVVGDRMFVGAWDGTVYSFDTGATGVGDAASPVPTVAPRWVHRISDPNEVAFGRIVSSPAVVDVDGTQVVLIAGGATLYALDGDDGTELGSICLDPREVQRCAGSDTGAEVEVESSPTVVQAPDGRTDVVIGLDVHNDAGVGRTGVVRVRLASSPWRFEPVWKFDPETERTYTGSKLLTRGAGEGAGCGDVWGTAAVDVAADLVAFGTGSCNDGSAFGEKVFALRFSNGQERWRFDPPGRDDYDLDDDFGAAVQLFHAAQGLTVGAGSKDGTYYALDPATGATRWASHVGQAGHVDEGFAIGGIIGSPAVGTVGDTRALFVTMAISIPDDTTGEDVQRMFSLHAIDADTGERLWASPLTRQTYGHPTYANGVVLVPSTAGFSVQAFDAATGAPLWTSPPLNGPPSSGVAVAGSRIFLGAGTRQTDAGFKAFDGDTPVRDLLGADPQERLAGIWAFALAGG